MATIEKRGNSYRITVAHGCDIHGEQIRERCTWKPPAGLTPRQLEKELQRQAVLFEEQVTHSHTHDGNIRLADFTQIFFRDHARALKQKTAYDYEQKMMLVNEALGHIRLCDLTTGHINSFYANLQEEGIRLKSLAVPKVNFGKWLKSNYLTMADVSRDAKLSLWVVKQLKDGHGISEEHGRQIAAAVSEPYSALFRTKRDNSPLKPGTVLAYHRALSAVLGKAVKWGYIDTNPAANAETPSIARRKAKYLDEPDAQRLLTLLQDEPILWRTAVTFDLLSGLRRAELLGLRWCDVDFDRQILHIRQTWNYVPKKGCYIDTPKTEDSERFVKVARSAIVLLVGLRQWQAEQAAALGDAWQNHDDRIFVREDGRPLHPDSITKWFSAFVARAGLPQVTVHSLRHTYASLLISEGIPLVNVSHSLGHAQTSTTSNIYAHVISSAEAKALAVFDRFGDDVAQLTPTTPPVSALPVRRKKAAGS